MAPIPGIVGKTPHILVDLRLADDRILELTGLRLQRFDLVGNGGQGKTRSRRQAVIGLVSNDRDEGIDLRDAGRGR